MKISICIFHSGLEIQDSLEIKTNFLCFEGFYWYVLVNIHSTNFFFFHSRL